VGTDFLTYNGYDAKDVRILNTPNFGHIVSTVELNNGIWIVVDFRGPNIYIPISGPFENYDDVIHYVAHSLGWENIYQTSIGDNYETMQLEHDSGP
jgi:hypothetical protein